MLSVIFGDLGEGAVQFTVTIQHWVRVRVLGTGYLCLVWFTPTYAKYLLPIPVYLHCNTLDLRPISFPLYLFCTFVDI